MTVYKPADVLARYGMTGEGVLYTPVAWGHVMRGGDLLVVERHKPDNPMRSGQLVLPGGRRRAGEGYLRTAQRETLEETGVSTRPGSTGKFRHLNEHAILRPHGDICAVIGHDGRFWMHYPDSGKRYTGMLYDLVPLTEPAETEQASRRPRYVHAADVIDSPEGFTPACRILLEIVGTHHGRPLLRQGDIEMQATGIGGRLLRIAEPENP